MTTKREDGKIIRSIAESRFEYQRVVPGQAKVTNDTSSLGMDWARAIYSPYSVSHARVLFENSGNDSVGPC
jgi:hypothetical protein